MRVHLKIQNLKEGWWSFCVCSLVYCICTLCLLLVHSVLIYKSNQSQGFGVWEGWEWEWGLESIFPQHFNDWELEFERLLAWIWQKKVIAERQLIDVFCAKNMKRLWIIYFSIMPRQGCSWNYLSTFFLCPGLSFPYFVTLCWVGMDLLWERIKNKFQKEDLCVFLGWLGR